MNARPQPGDRAMALADGNPTFAPNAFIRIDAEGPVRLVMPQVEMGQGIYTGACTMLAEELDVGMDQIKVEHAPPNEALYGVPLLGGQATGGSTSTRSPVGRAARSGRRRAHHAGHGRREPLARRSRRAARCSAASCRTPSPDASSRSARCAKAAAALPMPAKVALKEPAAFSLIGKPLRRVDSADKVDRCHAIRHRCAGAGHENRDRARLPHASAAS